MRKVFLLSLLTGAVYLPAYAQGPTAPLLNVTSSAFTSGAPIPPRYAYCTPDGNGKTLDGGDVSPSLNWSAGPQGTQSYAMIVKDVDVPKTFELADKAGKTIPTDFPRQTFYHWAMADIPASTASLPEGADSQKIVADGKPVGKTSYGIDGANDLGKSSGHVRGGYDGPCPPWNDERIHHYHFIVYALDVPSLNLGNGFTGKQVESALAGHVLAQGEIIGTYSDLAPKQ